jgi:hypothetical protein
LQLETLLVHFSIDERDLEIFSRGLGCCSALAELRKLRVTKDVQIGGSINTRNVAHDFNNSDDLEDYSAFTRRLEYEYGLWAKYEPLIRELIFPDTLRVAYKSDMEEYLSSRSSL